MQRMTQVSMFARSSSGVRPAVSVQLAGVEPPCPPAPPPPVTALLDEDEDADAVLPVVPPPPVPTEPAPCWNGLLSSEAHPSAAAPSAPPSPCRAERRVTGGAGPRGRGSRALRPRAGELATGSSEERRRGIGKSPKACEEGN